MQSFAPAPEVSLPLTFSHPMLDVYRNDDVTWSVARGDWDQEDVHLYFDNAVNGQKPGSRFVVNFCRVESSSLAGRYDTAQRMRALKPLGYRTVVILDDVVQHFIIRTLIRLSGNSDVLTSKTNDDAYEKVMALK